MTDFNLGFGAPGSESGQSLVESDEITLDMGIDTTGGLLHERCPVGTHRFDIIGYEMQTTGMSEPMIGVQLVIVQSSDQSHIGARHMERLVIPSKAERCCGQMPHKPKCSWAGMMKFLRMRLEGMTGREWRDDQLKLNPQRDLVGCSFIATCTHKETPEEDPETKQPTGRVFTNAELSNYQPANTAASPNGAGVAPVMGYEKPADEPF